MDPSRVLVALQELEKWRDRRARLAARLRQVQARRRYLERELDVVRRKVSRLEGIRPDIPVDVPSRLPLATFSNVRWAHWNP